MKSGLTIAHLNICTYIFSYFFSTLFYWCAGLYQYNSITTERSVQNARFCYLWSGVNTDVMICQRFYFPFVNWEYCWWVVLQGLTFGLTLWGCWFIELILNANHTFKCTFQMIIECTYTCEPNWLKATTIHNVEVRYTQHCVFFSSWGALRPNEDRVQRLEIV